jgi:hypothetical protein
MHDTSPAQRLLTKVTQTSPGVVNLARLASVAALVEPPLLRRLRVQLAPQLHAGIEADLWFSRLSYVASASVLTLRTDVAALLRAQLAAPAFRRAARQARAIVVDAHRGHSDMLQLEDLIIWESILGHATAVDRAFDRVLATIDANPSAAAAVLRWFGQAQRRLPPVTMQSPPARQLLAAVSLHLNRVVPSHILAGSRLPDDLRNPPPALPTVLIGVELLKDGLNFDRADADNVAAIELPATHPLVVEASWRTNTDEPRTAVLVADRGQVAALEDLQGDVTIRTLAGGRYRIRSVEETPAAEDALESAKFLLATVPISSYDQSVARPYTDVDADREAHLISQDLTPLGAELLAHPRAGARRDNHWVQEYLSAWASRREPASSMLVWVGHGESDGESAWLATHGSERGRPLSGVSPDMLATAIRQEWQVRRLTPGAWAIVAVEANGAERFVELVASQLSNHVNAPARLALIGAGGRGVAYLGTFRKALTAALVGYTMNDRQITVRDLVSRIEDRLIALYGEQQVVIIMRLGDATPILLPRDFAHDLTDPSRFPAS